MDLAVLLPFAAPWLATVFLLSLRLGAAFAFSPLLNVSAVPASARVVLVLALAGALSALLALPAVPARMLDHPELLFVAAFSELALGAALGLGIQLAFAAFTLAGRLLDMQIGFGLVQLFDPLSNVRSALITTAFDQLAVLLFFLLNIHHVLLRGLAWSLERFPLGQPWPLENALEPLLRQVSAMFTLGIALAAPVVFCILMVELALAVLAHALPQMNMLVIGIQVKV
ncbi:MAG TPA: flagellar biosynthetic protein FliR, partial [Ramlibacter sp.]|nr:flagellar biosynthetic protein FliR [Ramlibacter sp.]